MRTMSGLGLLKRDSGGGLVLASWHSPHSMTWRWLVAFRRFRGDEWRVRPLWWRYHDNNGLQWGVRLPWWGILQFSQQRPMWFRDLYNRLQDNLHKERYETETPSPPEPPSFTVVDGGRSMH